MIKHVFLTGPPGTSSHTLSLGGHHLKPVQFSRLSVPIELTMMITDVVTKH